MKVTDPNTGKLIDSSELCPLIFKGNMCGYSGRATDCNKTFENCLKLCNERHFMGLPKNKS